MSNWDIFGNTDQEEDWADCRDFETPAPTAARQQVYQQSQLGTPVQTSTAAAWETVAPPPITRYEWAGYKRAVPQTAHGFHHIQSIGDLHQDEMLDDLQIREDWDQDVEDWDQDEMTVYDLAELPTKLSNDITDSTKWPVSEKLSKCLLVSPLPSHLECEICLEILNDPVQTTCCGQGYCKNCIAQVESKICPHCRAKVEVFPDKKSQRLINDLEILCPYHIENKCRWKGSVSELNNHLKNCDIKPITCPLGCNKQFERKNKDIHITHLCSLRKIPCKYCQVQVMHKNMSQHSGVCPKTPVPCPNKCSSKEVITREKMSQHIEKCPNQAVNCKYFEFGCNKKEIKRKDYKHHLSSTMEQHLCLVAEYAKNERKARMQLEEKIVALERKLNALSK